jgi:hypothetical protein
MAAFSAFLLVLSTASGPLDAALALTEPPKELRAAFTLSVSSGIAQRRVRYDPRVAGQAPVFRVLESQGEDSQLDALIAEWREAASPDALLFADGLRGRLGASVSVSDLGAALVMDFRPALIRTDTELDADIAGALEGQVWFDPQAGRIVRVETRAPRAFSVPQGARITRLEQTYVLQTDETLGVSYIAAIEMRVAGGLPAGIAKREANVSARLLELDLFFADAPSAMVQAGAAGLR